MWEYSRQSAVAAKRGYVAFMNSTALQVTAAARPPGVWVICSGILVSTAIALFMAIAYFGYRDHLPPEFLQTADQLRQLYWINLGIITVLGLASGWMLFQMRASAVQWFGACLVYAAVAGAVVMYISGIRAGLTPSLWLKSIAGDIVEALIFAYCLRLRGQGKLRGRILESKRNRISPPLLLAGVVAASISAGGRVALVGTLSVLVSSYVHAIGNPHAMRYAIALAVSGLFLAVSGIALWNRTPAARELNAVGATLVGFLWGTTPGITLGALCISALCLTRRSVSAYYLGLSHSDPAAAAAHAPRALVIFNLVLAGVTLVGLIWITSPL
jgi:hypothetical protein